MLRFLTAGETHGKALIGILEGIPAGLKILAEDINTELARRQLGYGRGGRMKIEKDEAEIIYLGVFLGIYTTFMMLTFFSFLMSFTLLIIYT